MGDALTIQGQTVKVPLQSLGKLSIFQFCPYFSNCLSIKSGKPNPIEIIYFFKINKDRSITAQSFLFSSWKLWTEEAFEIGWFLTKFLQEMAEKHFVF